MFARGISQDTWQILRNGAKARNSNIYPVYNHMLEYRKTECTPAGIEFGDMEVKASLQAVLDHQLSRMLDDPLYLERVSALPTLDNFDAPTEYIIKYGFDGMSQVSITVTQI